jgi:membrane-bound lytic murein transglycosylase D
LIRTVTGSRWRSLIASTVALMFAACSSVQKPSEERITTPDDAVSDLLQWEETTREFADDLMAEAQRLQGQGNGHEAVAMADEAVCAALETPAGYVFDVQYLDYLAELIEEANELEAGLVPVAEEPAVTEDFVILPPIDLLVDDEVETEIEIDSPLPPSDFPLELNSTVERFLEAMVDSGEYHERIETGLARAGTYLPMIRLRFAGAGLPQDLSYLPLIESAFSVRAYSRARAHGMWQFISSTGRHYGLDIGSLIDERRDPERSTDAAIAYLSDLHDQFDDWYLALAAYNSGSGNVRRAIRRAGSRDFWTLRRYLPRETRNYVPAFIASVIVAKQPQKYGFTPPVEIPWSYETIEVPDALDLEFLASTSGISLDDLRDLNPAIRRDLTPARSSTLLRLPPGSTEAAASVLESTPRDQWAPRMIHTVRSGDSLYSIARRYGSSVSAIRQANALRGSLIRPGQNLIVPRFGSQTSTAAHPHPRTADGGVYVVQRNDTLWDIARGFSVTVDGLCAANGLSRGDVIRPGQRLNIPTGASASYTPTRQAPVMDSGTIHVVRTGDTLYDIALHYNVSVNSLKQINGLRSSRIYPGKELRIPSSPSRSSAPSHVASEPGTYQVQKGDTLYDIARRFGVSVSELRRVNGLRTSRIYPGDVLQIPTSQAKG